MTRACRFSKRFKTDYHLWKIVFPIELTICVRIHLEDRESSVGLITKNITSSRLYAVKKRTPCTKGHFTVFTGWQTLPTNFCLHKTFIIKKIVARWLMRWLNSSMRVKNTLKYHISVSFLFLSCMQWKFVKGPTSSNDRTAIFFVFA